jgi:diguanylate cyclase (GGDEF)-like protein/PAS domain S-box-containing protein
VKYTGSISRAPDWPTDWAARMTSPEETTQSIDVGSLFTREVASSGTFDLRSVQSSSLGQLLQAIPVPSLLVDPSGHILFANWAGEGPGDGDDKNIPTAFPELLPNRVLANRASRLITDVFASREIRVWEAPMSIAERRMWGRMHFRPIRMGTERSVLIIIEDLTAEKKRMLFEKKHREELTRAKEDLERRVQERTAELVAVNERLRLEIGERKRANDHLQLAARIISSTNEAIVVTDAHGTILEANGAYCRTTGRSKAEAIGSGFEAFDLVEKNGRTRGDVWLQLRETGEFQGEVWTRRRNGQLFPILLSVSPLTSRGDEVSHYVSCFSEITRMKQTQQRLNRLAHYDPLTGLSNRLLFHDRLRQAIVRASRDKASVAVVLLDLDGFKNINDTMGHRFGDKVLITVGERLRRCIRVSDTACRWGGDEFALILPGVGGARGVASAMRKVMDELAKPVSLDGREVFIAASAGVAMYPLDGEKVSRLIQKADTALYHVKMQGKNSFRFFSREMNANLLKRLKMENMLRLAMSERQFLLHYQPIFEAETGRTVAAEALLRVRHPERGIVSAAKLIPVAEDTGLIIPLGDWILRSACEQYRRWQKSGLTLGKMAVNVSGRQIKHRGAAAAFLQILKDAHLDPKCVEIELTESVMIEDSARAIDVLSELRQAGMTVSMDDFGRGFSSLGFLKDVPIDKVKMDRSFLKGIPADPEARALVQAILTIAHSRQLAVVAEGVETVEQFGFLRSLGCDLVQGFFIGHPVSDEDFAQRLREERNPAWQMRPAAVSRQVGKLPESA